MTPLKLLFASAVLSLMVYIRCRRRQISATWINFNSFPKDQSRIIRDLDAKSHCTQEQGRLQKELALVHPISSSVGRKNLQWSKKKGHGTNLPCCRPETTDSQDYPVIIIRLRGRAISTTEIAICCLGEKSTKMDIPLN